MNKEQYILNMKNVVFTFIIFNVINSAIIVVFLVDELKISLNYSLLTIPIIFLILTVLVFIRRKRIFLKLDINEKHVALVYKKQIIQCIKNENIKCIIIKSGLRDDKGFILFSNKTINANELKEYQSINNSNEVLLLLNRKLKLYIERMMLKI